MSLLRWLKTTTEASFGIPTPVVLIFVFARMRVLWQLSESQSAYSQLVP